MSRFPSAMAPPDQRAAPGIDHGTQEISRVELSERSSPRRLGPLLTSSVSCRKRGGYGFPLARERQRIVTAEGHPLRPNRSIKVANASSCCLTKPRVASSLISPVFSSKRDAQLPTKISGLFMVKASRNTIILRRSY